MDGTFKVVKPPFQQLFSVHAFVKRDRAIKQVPLIFVLMSSRRTSAYRAVFAAVRRVLPSAPAVTTVVSDFELALWKSVQTAFPGVEHRGCAFHWAQAVWRQLSQLGLAAAYRQQDAVHRFCRRIMSLPFLPPDDISATFTGLQSRATSDVLKQLLQYVDKQWINHPVWPPTTWSVYRRAIRTNNDCESWHARLNRKAETSNLAMYKLIELLHREAKIVRVSLSLLCDGKVQRTTSKSHRHIQTQLSAVWDEYDSGAKSADDLLRACAHVYVSI